MDEETKKQLIAAFQDKPKQEHVSGACPNCGYCPHCGRGRQMQPFYPYGPYYVSPQPGYLPSYPMTPWYGTYTVTNAAAAQPRLDVTYFKTNT